MKIAVEVRGPKKPPKKAAGEFWDLETNYHGLPLQYAAEVVTLAESYASLISGTAGTATGEDPAYSLAFSLKDDDAPTPAQIKAQATGLQYSEMQALQKAGLGLLGKLWEAGDIQVKAGQRK